MAWFVVAAIVAAVGWGLTVAFKRAHRWSAAGAERRGRDVPSAPGNVPGWIGTGLAVALAIVPFFKSVPAGHVGIVHLFGDVDRATIDPGAHLVNPLKSVVPMSVQVEKARDTHDAASSDLQTVHVVMSLNYQLDPVQAVEVYRTVGTDYLGKIINPAAQEVVKAEMALHPASDILQKRPAIKARVQENLATWLAKYGVLLREVSISDVQFDPQYAAAIEGKQIQQQEAEKRRYLLEQAEKDAEIAKARAQGEADAAREKAKGEADALKLKADAQADYNRKVSSSLTPALVQQAWVDRWNGAVSTYSGGGALIQLPGTK